MGVTNRTHSTRPRSRLYSDIPRPDAPVIYTGAFPILTAWPGSIYYIGSVNNPNKKAENPRYGSKLTARCSDNVDAVRDSVGKSLKKSFRRHFQELGLSRAL